jgi:type II secretory ATPase GspE/PulE/Tfp pilus assembly ATPase PilB-like protein
MTKSKPKHPQRAGDHEATHDPIAGATEMAKGDPIIMHTSIVAQTSVRKALDQVADDIALHSVTENLTIKIRTNGQFRTIRVYAVDKDE